MGRKGKGLGFFEQMLARDGDGRAASARTSGATAEPARRRRLVLAALTATVALGGVFGLTGAMALPSDPPFIVNSTLDRVDGSIDGNCVGAGLQTAANKCTLRAAIQEANSRPGADTILVLPGTYMITIAPINENAANVGDFEILDPVTIEKAPGYLGDVIIDAGVPLPGAPPEQNGLDRIFEIHPMAGDVTLKNLTLQNGYAEEGGAIQNWSLGKLTLDGVTVQDSWGVEQGGGLNVADLHDYDWVAEPENLNLLPYPRVDIKRSTFTGNGSGGGGAAINNTSGGIVTISDGSVITLNPGPIKPDPLEPESFVLVDPADLPIAASAIANQARFGAHGTLRIKDSEVSLNAAESSGAGIISEGDSILVIERSLITGNRTEASGGGVYADGGKVTISETTVTKNIAANGGGLYSGGSESEYGLRPRFEVRDSVVSQNKAENGGGLLSDGEGHMFVTDSVFEKNHAEDEGAAILSEGRSNLTVTRTKIEKNESWGAAGGILTHSTRLQKIVDSEIVDNHAGVPHMEDGELTINDAGGGGLYTDGGPVVVEGTVIEGNTATEEGGGMSLHNLGDIVVRDTTLKNNKAYDGGGAENSATRVTFERVLVQGNRAKSEGGGLFNTSSGPFRIIDSTIRENTGAIGGGLANAPDNDLIIKGSLFLNNSARIARSEEGELLEESGHGGGLMSFADGDSLIENTTFSGNKAQVAGGGLFHDADGELRLHHITVWRNSAPMGGGVGVVESDFVPESPPKTNAAVVAKNSIIGGSVKGGSCDWYIRSEGGNVETGDVHTCFLAVTAATAQSPIELGVRDRRGDPKLWAIADNGGLTMTHALQPGSLAIDSSQVPCAVVDQRGVTRPQNGRCDAGAFEFQGDPPPFDNTPPETYYDPATDGPYQNGLETMAFTFHGTDNLTPADQLNFECRLLEVDLTEPPDIFAPWDPIPAEYQWNGCSSPWTVPLMEEGMFIFEVRAIDHADNIDPTPISHLLPPVGMTPPDTVILEKPPLQTNSRSALFSFKAVSEFTPAQFAEYECRLDSRDPAAWLECTSPMMYSNLTTGLHTFEVRAFAGEAAGPDPTPARYTWRVGPGGSGDPPLSCDEANITLVANADGWVDQVNPLQNHLFHTELEVRSDAIVPGTGPITPQNARAFFRFPFVNDAPDCVLESATLRLYSGGHTEGRTLEAVPVAQTWKESSLTWHNQPGTVPGSVPATEDAGEHYREWDVKAHIDAIRAGAMENHGWMIRDSVENDPDGGDQSFHSRETAQDPPEITLPELELRYVAADAAPPPARDETFVERVVHCGEIVTESTRLAADVTGCLGEGIAIGKPDIILDLNGHTVSSGLVFEPGEEDGLTPGIRNGYSNVEIRGPGVVTGFGYGVLLGPGTTHSLVHDLTLYRNMLAGVQLFDADNGRIGNTVRNNRISSNGETGIQLTSGTEGALIEDNFLISNGMQIHLYAASRNTIQNNTISGIILDPALDSDAGIVLENSSRHNLLKNNDVSDTGDAGIKIETGSHDTRIEGDRALGRGLLTRNGDAGIIAEGSNRIHISGITSHRQSDGGVVIGNSSGSSIVDSDLRFNPSGIQASNTNGLIVSGVDASHSLQDGIELGSGIGMQILNNVASHTGANGISMEGVAFDASGMGVGGARFDGNTTNENKGSGIEITVARHTVANNRAFNNFGFGIAAGELEPAPPLVANIDGGGNKASGNMEFTNCLGVLCDESEEVPLDDPDVTPPDTFITDGPVGPPPVADGAMTADENAVFTFIGDDGPNGTPLTAMRFECRVDAPEDPEIQEEIDLEPPDPNDPDVPEPPEGLGWSDCVSPYMIEGLEPGEHKFEVRAIDWTTNWDLTPAVYEWEIHAGVEEEGEDECGPLGVPGFDCVHPAVAPETRITAAPGELQELRRVVTHTEIDPETGEEIVTTSTEPMLDENDQPIVYLATTNRAAALRFVGSDDRTAGYNMAFECQIYHHPLDPFLEPSEIPASTPWGPCTSPKGYTGLEYGGHIFRVRSIDRGGNRDVTPAWHSWWIHPPPPDVTPPDTEILTGPDATTVDTTATFTFTGTDNQTPVEELTYECRTVAPIVSAWATCVSPHTISFTSPPVLTEHIFQVRAIDVAGNRADDGVAATYTWNVGPAKVNKVIFCGMTVTQSITVLNSVADCLAHGLIVGADNITIDLNGRTIDGKGLGAGILNNGYDNVTIKNGTLVDFDYGVSLNAGAKNNIVDGVTTHLMQDAGVGLGHPTAPLDPAQAPSDPPPGGLSGVTGNIVRSSTLVSNSRGVWITNGARDNLVRENLIGATSGEAVFLDRATKNLIEGNDIQVASKFGVLLEGATDNLIKGNSIAETGTGVSISATTSGTIGVESTGNKVHDNYITDSSGPAVEIEKSSDNEVVDNIGTETDSYAIDLYQAEGNLIKGNEVNGNKGGISLKGSVGNVLEGNDASESDSTGITISSGSFNNVVRNNQSNDNDGNGIYIGDETPAGQGSLVEGNTTNSNKTMGITASKPSHIFRKNVAMDNGSWGINVGDPSNGRASIDGGGNIAQGNAGPLGIDLKPQQCYGVNCLGGPGSGDQIAPSTSLLDMPLNPSPDDLATFRFTGADNASPVTFECRLDSTEEADWHPCQSPASYPGLEEGSHTFEVRALDMSGNYDPTPATYTWVIELGSLTVTIDSSPDRVTVETSARFTFSANRSSGVTYQCALVAPGTTVDWDSAPTCSSPRSYSGLAVGSYEFWVRATDLASTPDTDMFAWTIGPPPVPEEVFCGQVISKSTRVLNDLVDCGGFALMVGKSGITIDLDGHVIDGVGMDAGIFNPGYDDVTITNGLVHQFLYGIQLNPGTARNVVSNLRIESNAEAGIALSDADQGGEGNTIRDNTIFGNELGIALFTGTQHTLIRGNTLVANSGEAGILSEFASQNRIEQNTIVNSGGAGVFFAGGGSTSVLDNTIKDSGGPGISAGNDLLGSNNNLIRGNSIRGGQGGVFISGNGNRVEQNTVSASTGPGVTLELANDNVVRGNELGGNGGGIALAQAHRNTITQNNASGTLGAGIAVGELSASNIIRDNTASGNGGDGIEVSEVSIINQGNILEGNTADANGGDGIYVEGGGHLIKGNVAQLNGGWGIYTVGGTDGGGNFAAGNMEPDQCFGVVCAIGVVPGAPDTWIVSGPADVDPGTPGVQSNSRNASFLYMGADDDSTIYELVFECRIDSTSPSAWEDCEYPAEFLNLSPGTHVFEVRAIDQRGSGLADPTPARFEWTYVPLPSGVAPLVTIDIGPADTDPETTGVQTPLLEAIFTFHANEPDVDFQCRVDSNAIVPCGFGVEGATFMHQGAFEWAFAENEVGPHTFYVRAIDFEGNVGPWATFTWTVLGVVVTFTDGPGFTPATGGPQGDPATGGPTASASAEIHFEANVADAEFWCRFDSLDPGDFFPCASPFRAGPAHLGNTAFPEPLLPGEHMLEVFAESELMGSAAELEPAVYEWEVVDYEDTTPPDTTIERAPGPADLSSTIFEFTGVDDLTPDFLLRFQCQVQPGTAAPNENDWFECTSPFNLLDVYTYADALMAAGEKTFYVRAVDMFEPEFPNPQQPDFEGNVDLTPASHTWVAIPDTRPPLTEITGGPANGASVAEADPYTFVGLDNATPLLALEFECALVPAPLTLGAAVWGSCDSPHSVNAAPGNYTFAVRALDLAGNTGPAATRAITFVAAPVVTILSGPPGKIDPVTGVADGASTSEAAILTFRSDQDGSTFECSLDGGDFVSCNTPAGSDPGVFTQAYWVVESGEHEVEIRAINPQGVVGDEAVYEWLVALGPDTVPPNTTITSGPTSGTLSTSATFTFTGTDNRTPTANLRYECALNSTTSYSSCVSPQQYGDLARGSHTLRVRAIDVAGNMDPTPAIYTWIVAPPPIVTITSGPGIDPAPEESTSTSATFTFTSDVAGVTFHCWLDGKFNPSQPGVNQPAPCASGVTYENLGMGEHLFAVRAVDSFGNIGQWEDVEFIVLPPQARITSAPATGTGTTATFEFTTEPLDPNAVFYCAIDDRPLGLCTSPKTYNFLWPGQHTFRVQTQYDGVDWRGEPLEFDPVPATHTWTVQDFDPPDTYIDFGPSPTTSSTSAYLGVSSDDPTATVTCTLNGTQVGCEQGIVTELTDLTPGAYTFTARAVDMSGNVDPTPASHSWTIAAPSGPPNTPTGSNVVVSLPQPGGAGNATVTFFGVQTAGHTTLEQLGGGPSLPEGFGGSSTRMYDISTTTTYTEPVIVCLSYDPLLYGSPTPSVRLLHFDGETWLDITTVNNPFSSPAKVCGEAESFSLFAIALASGGMAPEAYIISGPDGPLGPSGLPTTTSGSATFEFWVDQPNALALCSVDGEPPFPCESPVTVGPFGVGEHEFTVSAINELGWSDLTPALYEWEVIGPDVTPPSTVITKGPANGSETPNFIQFFEFSGSDDFTPAIELDFECSLNGQSLGNCESPEEIEVTAPGTYTLVVRAIDEAGNVDPVGASRTWTVIDMSAPDTEILTGPEEETTETSATFTFEGFELIDGSPVNQFECALDEGEFEPCTSPHFIAGPLENGLHVFHVRAVDSDGNRDISPAYYEWLVIGVPDTTPPETFIVVSPDPANSGPDIVFAFAADEAVESFECNWGSGPAPASPPANNWQECGVALFLEGLGSGQHWLWVRAIDLAGNVDPTPAPGTEPFVWITTGEPSTTITSGPPAITGAFTATFTFTSDQAGATFQCSVDGTPWVPCTSPFSAGPFLPGEGGEPMEHEFEVRAVNQFLNANGEQVMDLSPATWTWSVGDVTPPETELLSVQEIGPAQFLEPGFRFTFRGSDDLASSYELEFECALDDVNDSAPLVWEQCGEPWADDSFFHEVFLEDVPAGEYHFLVRAMDLAGNVDPTPAATTQTFTIEAEPETEITLVTPDMAPDFITDSTTVTFTFTGTGASFECALDSVTFTPCTSPATYDGIPYGNHLFRVQAVGALGTRDLSPAEFEWVSGVLTPPELTLDSTPVDGTTDTTAVFEFSSPDPLATFWCTLDGVGPLPCLSGVEYTVRAGVEHTFEVFARTPFLLVDGEPLEYTWTVTDLTAPDTFFVEPLVADVTGNEVVFTFDGEDPGGTPTSQLAYQCSLDAAPFTACSSPLTLSGLAGGEHTFRVRAVDSGTLGANPNADPDPATHTWQVVAPPATVITGPVPNGGTVTSSDVTVTFFDQPGSTYQCRLDATLPTDPFTACTSPLELTGLTNGEHVLEVRAITALSVTESPPASYEFEVDAPDSEAPETFIALGLADGATTASTSATFVFTGTDNLTAVANLTYECRLDPTTGTAWQSCEAGHTVTGLGVGPHTLEVRAVDLLGNVDETPATRSWTVVAGTVNTTVGGPVGVSLGGGSSATFENVTAEGVTTLDVLVGSSALPAGYLPAGAIFVDVSTTASFSGDVEVCIAYDTGSLDEPRLLHFENGAWVDVTTTLDVDAGIVCGVVSSLSPFGVAEAPGLSPQTTIAQAPEAPVLETQIGAAQVQFQFTSNDPLATFQCSLDGSSWGSCSTPRVFTSPVGQHTLLVRAVNQLGYFDLTPASHTWEVLARPIATITSGPEDKDPLEQGVQTDETSATFEFESDQAGSTFECQLTAENSTLTWSPCESPKTYTDLALEEEYTFEVRAINAAGHESLFPAEFEWEILDLTPPVTTIHTGPPALTNSTSATFTFSADEPATFTCTLNGTDISLNCASPITYTGLGAGQHTFEVVATDLGENQNVELEPATWTWTVDTQAPAIQLDAETAGDSATFTFSATDDSPGTLAFECRLDDGAFAVCASPKSYDELEPGERTFEVRTVDAAGNTAVASHQWISPDVTTPETQITGTDTGSMIIHFSGSDNFSSTENLTYECSLDDSPWEPCVSPAHFENDALGVGEHTFRVRAIDEAGNVDPTPETHTWTVLDGAAPETTITGQPDASTADTSASFSFTGSDNATEAIDLAFECSLDGGAWISCASPKEYTALSVGSHTFRVRATDEAGNTDGSPAAYTWTIVDVTAPETTITSGPDASTPATSASLAFTGSDNAAGALSFECSLDGAPFAACVSPKAYSGLAIGPHTFEVRATDAAGNVDSTPASYSWTVVDATAPQTTITSQPPASTPSTSASFEFTGSDNHTAPGQLTFECSLDGDPFAACTSPHSYSDLSIGSHTFRVRATDEAGNTDASPALYTWTVQDAIAPNTTITDQPPASTGNTTAVFSFTGSDNHTPAGSLDFQCSVDGGAFQGCTSPRTINGLAPGVHTFAVRAVDAAGNADPTPATYTWTVLDTTAPETTITGQPTATTTSTTAVFTFTGSDNVTPAASLTFQCSLDGAAFSSCTSGITYNSLSLGSHTFQVRATDQAGNTDATPAGRTWTIQAPPDTTPPDTTITAQPPATTTQTSASFSFTSSEAGSTFQCSLDNATFTACSSGVNYSNLLPGAHTFRVRAIDAAGNVDSTPASYSWTIEGATNCGAPQTLTASGDAWIDQGSQSSNKGSDSILKLMSKGPANNLRALVRFNLPALPQGCAVENAVLRIYAKSSAANRMLEAYQVAGSWTEGGVTWANQPATTGPAVAVASGTGYREWNVAAMVQAQYGGTNNGFLIRDMIEGQDAEQQLHAREESRNRPQLVLTLGNGAPPPPPNGAPDTQITGTPLASTSSTSATFTFTGTDDVTPAGSLTFQCQLDVADNGPWNACSSPQTYSGLAPGSHIFRVRAVDGAGNVDPQPAVFTWVIDQTPPETVITASPAATTTSTSASFSFTSSEANSTFECSLDTAAFASCTSPRSHSGLAVGAHTFRVRAIDAAGNVDGSPATFNWTIQSGGGGASCGTSQTVNAVADSWIEQGSPSSNKGSDGILKVMSKSGNGNLRALVRFDLPTIPSGCVLDTATLRLFAASTSGSQRTLQALRLNGSWTEGGVNWSNQPATTGTAATTTSASGWRQWTVTSIVGAMYASTNNGFLIRDATEGQDAEQQFHAREKGSNGPQLVLTFKTP